MAESGGSSASASASASGEASASGDGPSRSTSEAANIGFDVWVRSHGGDEQFISILHSHGFHSILSLGNLDMNSSDSSEVLEQLNCGQRCFLRGLIQASKSTTTGADAYATSETQATKLSSKTQSIRDKLNRLFNKPCSSSTGASEDDFLPSPNFRTPLKRKKAKQPTFSKKKVKEIRVKVVGLTSSRDSVPVGAERDKLTKSIWIRGTASASEIATKIKDVFGWSDKCILSFQYVNGRYMRPATLDDVENSTQWDAETIKALMGSGSLHVIKTVPLKPQIESAELDKEVAECETKCLVEMFPNVSRGDIQSTQSDLGFSGAIDKLLGLSQNAVDDLPHETIFRPTSRMSSAVLGHSASFGHSSTFVGNLCVSSNISSSASSDSHVSAIAAGSLDAVDSEPQLLEHLLRSHASRVVTDDCVYKLRVDRSTEESLWQAAIAFYKGAKAKPKKLKREFVIEFQGEIGVDSGALRREFFEAVVLEANKRLFEGEPDRRLPKKDWGLELMFEMCGMMVAHSIVNGGPGFSCLSPCVYEYLMREEIDQCYPAKDDIPLNVSTHHLITFIDEMVNASTEDEIDCVLDKPTNSHLLNGCGWSIITPIDPSNKLQFLHHLLLDEVITKRERNLKAFILGLNALGIGDMVKRSPAVAKKLFVKEDRMMTPDDFIKLVGSVKPKKSDECLAYEFFKDFVFSLEDTTLRTLLKFVTGLSAIPPMGLENAIELSYLPQDIKEIFPKAQACFSKLYLPTIHNCKEEFQDAFHKALLFGFGYGIA